MPVMRTVEKYMAIHRLHKDAHVIPAPGTHDMEAALRIAGLLYIKELFPDWPRNLDGYAVLLALLRYHLEAIMRDTLIDTDLALDAEGDGDKLVSRMDTTSRQKGVLIFLCILGNTACLIANEKYEKGIHTRGRFTSAG